MKTQRRFVVLTVAWTVFAMSLLSMYIATRSKLKPLDSTRKTGVSRRSITVQKPQPTYMESPVNKTAVVLERQEARQKLLQRTCHKLGLDVVGYTRSTVGRNILVNDEKKYIYCVVGKVASSTWKQVLLVGTGKIKENRPSDVNWGQDGRRTIRYLPHLADFSPKSIVYRLKHYYKFVFVRHPLERTISAFHDKFRHQANYMRHFGVRIVRRLRGANASAESLRRGNDVTLAEYVRFLLDPSLSKSDRATRRDIHWASQSDLCRPCTIRYDFIGHYETLDDDGDYVVSQLHLDPRAQFPHQFDADGRPKKRRQTTDKDMEPLFSEVPPEDLSALKRLYARDYELFGFN